MGAENQGLMCAQQASSFIYLSIFPASGTKHLCQLGLKLLTCIVSVGSSAVFSDVNRIVNNVRDGIYDRRLLLQHTIMNIFLK